MSFSDTRSHFSFLFAPSQGPLARFTSRSIAMCLTWILATGVGMILAWHGILVTTVWAQDPVPVADEEQWIKEIENTFIPSKHCKQCHDRHYEEWKGMRERTEDLKSFGRVDGALLHGTALKSPVFRTVLGLWLQTSPSPEQRTQCLTCHAPAVTVFPQHTDRIIRQVMSGPKQVKIEGIGCTSCHLITGGTNGSTPGAVSYPAFTLSPGSTMFGPYGNAEENLVHTSEKAVIYDGANYCTACHFSKVRDITQPHLDGALLQDMVCQDCHMEQSTGSSTGKRGRLSRPIGRHWFQGVVMPGVMLSNRNLQAEWSPRLDIKVTQSPGLVEGTVNIRNGSLSHMFPGGDPILKQFIVTVTLKDNAGRMIGETRETYGRAFEELLQSPIAQPLVSGGTTRHLPFRVSVPEEVSPQRIEVSITYALIPTPGEELKDRYLATLPDENARREAENIIEQYTSPRLLTFRTKSLESPSPQVKTS